MSVDVNIDIGKSYHAIVNGIKPYRIHILALVDEDMLAYKYWGHHKKRWFYNIEAVIIVASRIDMARPKK